MKSLIPVVAKKLLRLISSFWIVVLLLAVGWGPAFIADLVARSRPDLSADATYYVLQWMRITWYCTLLAIATAIIWVVRFIIGRFSTSDKKILEQ